MPAWLKAGFIGAAILALLNLIGLIPIPGIGCLTTPLMILTYAAAGALAASYLPPVRMAGASAGQGALAGLIAAAIGGLVTIVVTVIQSSMVTTSELINALPPETLQQLRDAGIDPSIFTGAGFAGLSGLICCSIGIVLGLALGAVGGAIYAAVKPA